MKIFVLGIPHTRTSLEFLTCAYTQKVRNLCRMMHRRGHEVVHLGTEGSDPECSEHVSVVSDALWRQTYGDRKPTDFYEISSDGKYAPLHMAYAENARKAIRERGGDPWSSIVCVTWGGYQNAAVDGVTQFVVESGIGYPHASAKYRAYESYAWMHRHLGKDGLDGGGAWYHVVIPNAFDPDLFGPVRKRSDKGDYLLYLGRLIESKGVKLAVQIAKEAGMPIKLVGQGDPRPFLHDNPHASYLPPVGPAERRDLLASARALLCPTYYVEPFGGVAVEAMLSGTPAITTDWGVFPETVQHGYTGYRCRTLEQFIWAARNIENIDPNFCREYAEANYSLDRVALMYEEFFESVLAINGIGWTDTKRSPERTNLDWLQRYYPPMDRPIEIIAYVPRVHVKPLPASIWQEAQEWERKWWGTERSSRWDEEVQKQTTYARLMGLPNDLDVGDKSVLDVGCGPSSMLLRGHHGPSVGIDPLTMSEETLARYAESGVEMLNVKAEGLPLDRTFDEVWIYNCLQHTEDPSEILRRALTIGRTIRIFEWLNTGTASGHPQNLTESLFEQAFKADGRFEMVFWNVGRVRDLGGSASGEYLALCAERTRER